jgi:hypothetical protein
MWRVSNCFSEHVVGNYYAPWLSTRESAATRSATFFLRLVLQMMVY